MKKVLIIEDLPIFQELITSIIKQYSNDVDVLVVSNQKEAIDIVKKNIFNLIVLDGQLKPPGYADGHGRAILAHLSDDQKKITVINSADDDFILEAEADGVIFSLCRKNDEDDLRDIVKKFLIG